MATPKSLSDEQIGRLRAELAAGNRPMVWFTAAAVGVDAGRSAKVVALTEPHDGDFIQVRPTGSHDELSFSASELTMEKPARRRRVPASEPEPRPDPAPVTALPVTELLVVRERPPRKSVRSSATIEPATTVAVEPKADAPSKPRGRTKPPAPVTVTLTSDPEGAWTVDVLTGTRRAVRGMAVPAGSVAAAARALGGEIERAIDGALTAARDQQRARVEALEAELAAARAALAQLSE